MMNLQSALMDRIRQADRRGANALLDAWAGEHGYDQLFTAVLEPALQRIGDEWQLRESFTLAQAYVAAKVAEDILAKIAAQPKPQTPATPVKGPVILGNIEEDFHALGRRMVGTFLRTDGWNVHDLGNDVAPARFVDKALETGARVIGASAMMLTTARNLRRLREEIDRRGLAGRIQLAVGGAVFLVRPGLVQEVGGDGTAASALGAVKLFDQLWEQSQRQERRV
jgi:methanogenic corrinoid protein MtbC1